MIGEAPHTRRAMVGEAAMLQLLLHLPALAANYHRECRLARRFLRTWPANSWISYVKPISFPPHHYQHHGQTKEDILINQPLTIEKNSSCFYKQPQVLGYHGNDQRAPSERHSDDITVDNLQAGWTLDQYALRDNYTQRLGIRFPGECINVLRSGTPRSLHALILSSFNTSLWDTNALVGWRLSWRVCQIQQILFRLIVG